MEVQNPQVKTPAAQLYNRLKAHNHLGEHKRYMNIGYWAKAAKTFDQAGDHLVQLLLDQANFPRQGRLLDVGCGFAEQDLLIAQAFPQLHITAVNPSAYQLSYGKNLAPLLPIAFVQACAEDLPFPAAHFAGVMCLEAAFHFQTRNDFLQEAYRVLQPGASLLMIDFCLAEQKLTWLQELQLAIGKIVWKIPSANLCPPSRIREQLKEAEFIDIQVQSIWQDCYPEFVRQGRQRIESPEIKARMSPWFRWFLKLSFALRNEKRQNWMDYVLISATRPQRNECGTV